jgi:hypothetical protein
MLQNVEFLSGNTSHGYSCRQYIGEGMHRDWISDELARGFVSLLSLHPQHLRVLYIRSCDDLHCPVVYKYLGDWPCYASQKGLVWPGCSGTRGGATLPDCETWHSHPLRRSAQDAMAIELIRCFDGGGRCELDETTGASCYRRRARFEQGALSAPWGRLSWLPHRLRIDSTPTRPLQ